MKWKIRLTSYDIDKNIYYISHKYETVWSESGYPGVLYPEFCPTSVWCNMADEAAKAKADRIRNLLSNYYGAGESVAPAASAGSDRPLAKQSVPIAPMLNPEEQHIADILRTYPLERLLTEHRSMAREIKNLDSDMQQLICENTQSVLVGKFHHSPLIAYTHR